MDFLQTIWEMIQSFLTLQHLLWGVIALIGLWAANTSLTFVNEIRDVVTFYRDFKKKTSEGGTSISDSEKKQLLQESLDVLEAVWDDFGGGIMDWVASIIGKLKFWK